MRGAALTIAACAWAATAAQAQFTESISVSDFSDAMKKNEQLLKSKEADLKQNGILDPKADVSAELVRIGEMDRPGGAPGGQPSEAAKRTDAASDVAAPGLGKKKGDALTELKETPGARAPGAPPVQGHPLGTLPDAPEGDVEARIERIARKKVHAEVAEKAFKNLLWAAHKADLAKTSTPEVRGLFAFLKRQLEPEVEGAELWPILWEGDMPRNILATYSGVIKVGPSFAGMARGGVGQMTVLFHEKLHGHDDGGDHSAIMVNRMTGRYPYDPRHRVPAMHNATEMLAYTDMAKWVEAY